MDLSRGWERTDEELIRSMACGQSEALGALFNRYFRLVFTISWRILKDRTEAEDVMQDVFLELHRDAVKFDAARGSGRTWILQYAYHRSLNRRKYLSLRGFYEDRPATALADCDPPHYRPDDLTTAEWRSVLMAGMETLTVRERRTLELATFEGLTLREISVKFDESLTNVRNHYYRGLKKLRKQLVEDMPNRKPAMEEADHAER